MSDKPKCPDTKRLQELMLSLDGERDSYAPDSQFNKDLRDSVEALSWLETFLSDRKLYHKKQQLKNKILRAKAEELGLLDEVEKLADTAVFNHVANSDPDEDDVELAKSA